MRYTIPMSDATSDLLHGFIGNQHVTAWLARAIAGGQTHHAYLITGPDQIGKRTLALAFAQAVQCEHNIAGFACGECATCRKVAHGNHPDVLVLALPKDKVHYSIEQVRQIIEDVALKPSEGRRRIIIVPDSEKLTLPALQSTLKVLEEPPLRAMIVLTAASGDLLLPTILSRCQQVSLIPVVPSELVAALVAGYGVTPDIAGDLALLSGGRPGWAIEAAEHPELLEERRATLRELATLTRASRAERIAAAARYAPDRDTAQRTLELWLPWWRDVTLVAYGAPQDIRHTDDRAGIMAQARAWGAAASETFVRALIVALEQLDQNANPRLVFEVLLQSLPGL
jgi:DNA polymerase III subunit delta'